MSSSNNFAPGLGIHSAAKRGDIDSVKAYLMQGVDINSKDKYGMTPLLWAIKVSSINNSLDAMVEFLLSEGAKVDAKTHQGSTPLHLAALNGCNSIIPTLIAHGATVNASNKQGKLPLYLAVENNHLSTVELMLANGANIDSKSGAFGFTPLYFAKTPEMIDLLKKNGANSLMYSWARAIHLVGSIFQKLISYGLTW